MAIECGMAVNITATGLVGPVSPGSQLLGFYVNSTSAGTLVLRRGGASGTVLCGTITPAIGFHRFPADCPGGLHATVGGTLDVTFFLQ
jgi:hypothetical protein